MKYNTNADISVLTNYISAIFNNKTRRGELLMVSYDKLWKKLIDLKLKKKDLKDMTGIGSTTMSKLINNEPVSMAVMIKICILLKCNIGDVMDVIL